VSKTNRNEHLQDSDTPVTFVTSCTKSVHLLYFVMPVPDDHCMKMPNHVAHFGQCQTVRPSVCIFMHQTTRFTLT